MTHYYDDIIHLPYDESIKKQATEYEKTDYFPDCTGHDV